MCVCAIRAERTYAAFFYCRKSRIAAVSELLSVVTVCRSSNASNKSVQAAMIASYSGVGHMNLAKSSSAMALARANPPSAAVSSLRQSLRYAGGP